MTEIQNRPLKVFLCHASDDKPVVRDLYHFLRQNGIDAWLDEEKLLPGQDRHVEIPKALKNSDAILVCLSKNATTKEGYAQKEIEYALNVADEKPKGTIFVIPVRLEECNLPDRLSQWQWVDLFRKGEEEWLLRGLEARAHGLGIQIPRKSLPEESVPLPRELPGASAQHPEVSLPPAIRSLERPIWGGIEFVKVPAGPFLMGSIQAHESAFGEDTPRRIVDIPHDYWIGRFPVTNKQFAEFIEATHYVYKATHADFKWVNDWKKKSNYPVVNVSWNDAQAYLKWLDDVCGKQLPKGLSIRLPTEAEWEKAARGTDGRKWPWGNVFDKYRCNNDESGIDSTSPVDAYSPQGDSPYGAADMSGNVWEWTQSLFKLGPYDLEDGRENLRTPGDRVLRGGSWEFTSVGTSCEYRYKFSPVNRDYRIGFRACVAPIF
jgi:formylglycine-generating enzyme required for sulfatase activity